MTIETQQDLDGLQRIGRVVSLVLQRMLDAMSPETREEYLATRRRIAENPGSGRAGFVCLFRISFNRDSRHRAENDTVGVSAPATQETDLWIHI